MKRGFLVAVGGAAIVIAGLSGCSSDEKKSESPATSAEATTGAGTASATAAPSGGGTKVSIDGQDQNVDGHRRLRTMGGNMNIAIGEAATGIAAVVSEGDSPTVTSVGLGNVNGVTLGYQPAPARARPRPKRRQHLQDHGHRDRYRHGQPHAAGEQAVRDRGHLPVAGYSVRRGGGVPRGAAVVVREGEKSGGQAGRCSRQPIPAAARSARGTTR